MWEAGGQIKGSHNPWRPVGLRVPPEHGGTTAAGGESDAVR